MPPFSIVWSLLMAKSVTNMVFYKSYFYVGTFGQRLAIKYTSKNITLIFKCNVFLQCNFFSKAATMKKLLHFPAKRRMKNSWNRVKRHRKSKAKMKLLHKYIEKGLGGSITLTPVSRKLADKYVTKCRYSKITIFQLAMY